MHVKRDLADSFWMTPNENRRNSSHLAGLQYSRSKSWKRSVVMFSSRLPSLIRRRNVRRVSSENMHRSSRLRMSLMETLLMSFFENSMKSSRVDMDSKLDAMNEYSFELSLMRNVFLDEMILTTLSSLMSELYSQSCDFRGETKSSFSVKRPNSANAWMSSSLSSDTRELCCKTSLSLASELSEYLWMVKR